MHGQFLSVLHKTPGFAPRASHGLLGAMCAQRFLKPSFVFPRPTCGPCGAAQANRAWLLQSVFTPDRHDSCFTPRLLSAQAHTGSFRNCTDLFKGNNMEDSTSPPGQGTSGTPGATDAAASSSVAWNRRARRCTAPLTKWPTRPATPSTAPRQRRMKPLTSSPAAPRTWADRLSEQAAWVAEAPSRAIDCSKSWVQDKPLEAVGVALALGFIIGRLTAR